MYLSAVCCCIALKRSKRTMHLTEWQRILGVWKAATMAIALALPADLESRMLSLFAIVDSQEKHASCNWMCPFSPLPGKSVNNFSEHLCPLFTDSYDIQWTLFAYCYHQSPSPVFSAHLSVDRQSAHSSSVSQKRSFCSNGAWPS